MRLTLKNGKTYKRASIACVKFFLTMVKYVQNFTLFCHKIDLCCDFRNLGGNTYGLWSFFSFFFCIIKKVFFEGPKKICFGSKFVLFISFCFPVQYCFFRGSAKKTNFGGMSFFFFWQSNFFLERLKKKLGGGGGQFFSNIIKKKNLYISVIFFGGQKKKFEWIKKNLLYGSLPHIN